MSGNIDEKAIQELYHQVDGFGVGTSVSNAPVVDFSLDIVEVEGKSFSKRGKPSGRKKLFRCPHCFKTKVLPRETATIHCECGVAMEPLLLPLIVEGKIVETVTRPQEIREYV